MTASSGSSGDALAQQEHARTTATVPVPRSGTPSAHRAHDLVAAVAALAGEQPLESHHAEPLLTLARRLSSVALWGWDLRTGTLAWSPEMYALMGLDVLTPPSREQWISWLHPDDRADLAAYDARVLAAKEPWEAVFRVLPPDGVVRHLKAWGQPILGDNNEVASVIGVAVEVTDAARGTFALEESRLLLDGAVHLTGLAFWTMNLDATALWWSPTMHLLAGTDPEQAAPTHEAFLEMIHPDDRDALLSAISNVMISLTPTEITARLVPAGRPPRHLRLWLDVHPGEFGEPRGVWGACLDVTAEQRTLEVLRANREEFRLAFDEAPNGMAIVEVRTDQPIDDTTPLSVQIRRVNQALLTLFGSSAPGAVVEGSLFVHPDDRAALRDLFRRSVAPGAGVSAQELRIQHADGGYLTIWVHSVSSGEGSGDVGYTRLLMHFIDITALRRTEAELATLALTDPVTKLANRTALEQRVQAVLPQVGPGQGLGLMLLDLDRFKVVNDSLGHVAGDALLAEMGRRLTGAVPPSALVVRLGGDEFAVLVHPCPSVHGLADLAGLVRARLRRPITLPGDVVLVCTASIGVTWTESPEHGMDQLYREADLALYNAKDAGRDAVSAFDDALRARADARITGERNLRTALEHDGIRLYLQPIVDLHTGVVASGEALARLEHPTLGMLMPNDFIEIAEDTGLVVEIDSRITELAVAALARPGGGPAPKIAVNVSPRTLDHPDYLRRLNRALARHGVHPSSLIVEVTESSLLDATGQRAAELAKIQALGMDVGIDDFGTGYSALAYLDRFALDFLKIDRSFVSRLGTSIQADAVVSAIISLAHAHQMSVTAEGVETQEQADALAMMGCDRGQGWLFGRPAPI